MNNHSINFDKKDYFKLSKKKYNLKGVLSVTAAHDAENYQQGRIWVDDLEILPETAFVLRPFYECDFDWGKRGGLSCYTTALAICLSIFKSERIAENLFECFKEEYVVHFETGDFEINIDLSAFLKKYREKLHPHLYSRFCYAALIDTREIMLYKDPSSGLISVNLAENYATHKTSVPDAMARMLNERKQRLVFRLFAKDKYIITGYQFEEIMEQVEEVMSKFYWQSIERLIKKQLRPSGSANKLHKG